MARKKSESTAACDVPEYLKGLPPKTRNEILTLMREDAGSKIKPTEPAEPARQCLAELIHRCENLPDTQLNTRLLTTSLEVKTAAKELLVQLDNCTQSLIATDEEILWDASTLAFDIENAPENWRPTKDDLARMKELLVRLGGQPDSPPESICSSTPIDFMNEEQTIVLAEQPIPIRNRRVYEAYRRIVEANGHPVPSGANSKQNKVIFGNVKRDFFEKLPPLLQRTIGTKPGRGAVTS